MTEPASSGKRQTEGTVLVVDDELHTAKAASRLLSSMGFEVQIATGGLKAVEICGNRGAEIDLVLLDLVLPDMTSLETLRRIRSLRPGIKVVLTSGYDRQESLQNFADMQLQGFVGKPYGYTELESLIRAVLRPNRRE